MHNPLTLLSGISGTSRRHTRTQVISFLAGLAVWCTAGVYAIGVRAATPDTAPPELKTLLSNIDEAANRQDIEAVMQFYSKNVSHADGLTYENMRKALSDLWQRYPQLNYRTELQSWQIDGNGIIAETVTVIAGSEKLQDREMSLKATLRSRQRYENQKIVRQEILAERTQITSGEKPPTVKVQLPDQIRAGQEYNFDAIVEEPLGSSLLIGTALEESIKAESYFNPSIVKLEPLPAGGLFKTGRAPAASDPRWISAVLVHKDGMTLITERLKIVGAGGVTK